MVAAHQERRGALGRLAAACAVMAACASPAAGQRLDIEGVASRGDRAETRRAFGFAARVSVPVLPFVSLAVGYSRIAGSGEIDGPTERLRNDLVFGTVDYELLLPLRLVGLELSAAAGIDVTSVESNELRGEDSGEVVLAHAPDNGFLASLTSFNGRHYRFGVGFSPLFGIPLTVRAAWQRRVTDLDACAPGTYAPFCGEMRSDQLLLGLSIGTR